MDLKGKVCLVTGGSSGIGASTAVCLAQKGARVASVSRTGVAGKLQALLGNSTNGTGFRFLKGDVADPVACRACIDQAVKDLGRIDVLVHSAGGPAPGGLFAISDEEWMNAFAVHVHSVFHLVRAAAPHMAKQGGGAVVLLGSAAGLRGCAGALAYGVAKGALPQFARALARELADQNIRVNCVSPGIIRTPFHASLTPEQAENNIQNRIPLHREGQPEDVAQLIVSLIENEFITGENFVIDGGMTMRIV
ncbi:MAG TPA: SDR family oxidoreductase [Candidatus Acidoferrum sp.]|nr:SDR family oxidoreductase [Candidatus Acidoferrum sp.]